MNVDTVRLSKNRTIIMGMAMICVVLFHSSLDFSRFRLAQLVKQHGDIGVDIFLMMSGMGIYSSLEKMSSIKAYIQRRVRRIVPAYLLANGCWFFLVDLILHTNGIEQFLLDVSSLSFWINGRLTTWYLSSLLVLQLLTPKYLQIWRKVPDLNKISIVFAVIMPVCITYTPRLDASLGHLLIFFYRIPAYLAGLEIGKALNSEKSTVLVPKTVLVTSLGMSILILVIINGSLPIYLRWALRYTAFLPIAVVLSCFFSRVPGNAVVSFFGTRSLEIYLLHEKVLWILSAINRHFSCGLKANGLLINMLSIGLCCIGAEILHRLAGMMISRKVV